MLLRLPLWYCCTKLTSDLSAKIISMPEHIAAKIVVRR